MGFNSVLKELMDWVTVKTQLLYCSYSYLFIAFVGFIAFIAVLIHVLDLRMAQEKGRNMLSVQEQQYKQ
jgi:hypothetical protein